MTLQEKIYFAMAGAIVGRRCTVFVVPSTKAARKLRAMIRGCKPPKEIRRLLKVHTVQSMRNRMFLAGIDRATFPPHLEKLAATLIVIDDVTKG